MLIRRSNNNHVHLSVSAAWQHLSMLVGTSAPSTNHLLKIQQQSHRMRINQTHEDRCTSISGQRLSKLKYVGCRKEEIQVFSISDFKDLVDLIIAELNWETIIVNSEPRQVCLQLTHEKWNPGAEILASNTTFQQKQTNKQTKTKLLAKQPFPWLGAEGRGPTIQRWAQKTSPPHIRGGPGQQQGLQPGWSVPARENYY